MGSSVSVLDLATFGSSLSVRSFVSVGSAVSINDIIHLGDTNSNTYIKTSASLVEFYVGSTKTFTLDAAGGNLHGSWEIGATSITSDRRLKSMIVPLDRTLQSMMPSPAAKFLDKTETGDQQVQPTTSSQLRRTVPGSSEAAARTQDQDGVQWTLRQLRPVSYSFKKGADAKNMRFGFIADELETVVPQLVRSRRKSKWSVAEQKHIQLQDLVALLTAAAQSTQALTGKLQVQVEEQARMMEEMRAKLKKVEAKQEEAERATKKKKPKTKLKAKATKVELLLRKLRRGKVERPTTG